jgi:uncharacterized protein
MSVDAARDRVLDHVLAHATADVSSIHGLSHWRRVEGNGRLLAAREGCDPLTVVLFAYLHDFLRENDGSDPQHGPRAADFIEQHWAQVGVEVSADVLGELAFACRYHTSSNAPPSGEVALCWDADRLDLPRVGIEPALKYFHSDAAKAIVLRGEYTTLDVGFD